MWGGAYPCPGLPGSIAPGPIPADMPCGIPRLGGRRCIWFGRGVCCWVIGERTMLFCGIVWGRNDWTPMAWLGLCGVCAGMPYWLPGMLALVEGIRGDCIACEACGIWLPSAVSGRSGWVG